MKEGLQNQKKFKSSPIPSDISDNDDVFFLGKPGKCALTIEDKVAIFANRKVALNIKEAFIVSAGTYVVLALPLKVIRGLYESDLIYISLSDSTESTHLKNFGTRYER